MKKTAGFLITVVVITFILGSCISTSDLPVSIEKEQPQKVSAEKSEYLTINTPYTLESLLIPVIQMNDFMMCLDYFDQFLEYNDYIFPDYLFRILGMETTNYHVGEGTVLYSSPENGSLSFAYDKALLSRDDSGNSWWQFRIGFNGRELFFEVLSNKYDIPQKIRSIDPESGFRFEIVPDIAFDFENAINEIPSEQLSASLDSKIEQNISEGLLYIFINPDIIGEEIVETPAGRFMTVLVRDFRSETMWVNYWLSPDVPGGIVRTSSTDGNGSEVSVTELLEIRESVEQIISKDDLIFLDTSGSYEDIPVNMEPGFSEGSSVSPIQIYPDEIHYGSVGDGEISYYKFDVDRRSDLFIEVEGLEGEAELLYYGDDREYYNWFVSSQGSSLNIEDYMVSEVETVYFSVNDIADEYSIGEHYSIIIYQSYILDSIGVMMRGDIYNNAEELASGKKHSLSVGSEGLDYFKTTVRKGSTLRISVINEPDFGSLIWFDTKNGSYSGMYSEWSSGTKTITIEGLNPGTECYYYFSSDTDLLDPLQKLVLEIIESP
ncbi:MAG: hypothetical protein KAR21_03110 [Spirochaetales bacterium]|nr:hypothetical protein [Spirochaetales bacterium]